MKLWHLATRNPLATRNRAGQLATRRVILQRLLGATMRTCQSVRWTKRDRAIAPANDDRSARTIPALFHFTDRRNVPMIRDMGGIYPYAELKRRGVQIPAPGGNEWSHDEDGRRGLDEYVHLCFRPNHPMEFAARSEGRIQDSIFLEILVPRFIPLELIRNLAHG